MLVTSTAVAAGPAPRFTGLTATESLVLQQRMEPSKRALQNMLPVIFHIACPWIFEYRT